ncbi:MAG: putative response regulator receiver [Betaproteobacteria bacterium]|nr:putative response regulator receiver [Betaproteobacteria bacterium]
MSELLRILLVEDVETDAALIRRHIERGGISVAVRRVESEDEYRKALTEFAPELILSDFSMPHFDGISALTIARESYPDIPFIFVSGTMGEERAIDALKGGATDYVLKQNLPRLPAAVKRAMDDAKALVERHAMEAGLRRAQHLAKLAHVITGPDGSFESWSETLPQLIGIDPSAMPKSTREWLDLVHPDDRSVLRDRAIESRSKGIRVNVDYRLRRADDKWMHMRQVIEPLQGEIRADEASRWFNTLQDVSEQIEAQEKIARLNRIYAVMSGINNLVVRVRDRQELFTEACRIAFEHGKLAMAWIGSLDLKTMDVTPVAWAGEMAEEFTKIKSSARDDIKAGKGAVGLAIRTRRLVFNNDIVARDFGGPRLQEILRLGFRSNITLPLFEGPTLVATFTMYAYEKNYFNEDELKLLTELAADISFALEHIGKEEKVVRLSRVKAVMSNINALIARARDRQALFDGACRIAVEHGKFGTAWIGAFDPVAVTVSPVAWAAGNAERLAATRATAHTDVAHGHGIVARAIKTRQPVFENDLAADSRVQSVRRAEAIKDGLHSLIAVPFVVEESVVGHLSLYAREVNFFDEDEVALLAEVATNISFALEHFRKEEKIARLSRIQAVMSGINALIVRAGDRQRLFDGACRIAVEQGHFGIAWIGKLDPVSLEVIPLASVGFDPADDFDRYKSSVDINHPRGRGLVGAAMRGKKPVFSNNMEMGVGERTKEALRRGHRSRIALPLLSDGAVAAVMVLYASEPDFFTADELRLLTEIAGDISFALDHISKEEKLSYLAFYDELTGLPNRTLLRNYLGRVARRAGEDKSKAALVMCDIQRFSHINETLGRGAGDALLREVSERLRRIWPEADNLARLSGNCFGGIVANFRDVSEIGHLIEKKIADELSRPFNINGEKLRISVTAAIAVFPSDGKDADTLLKNAEAALKKAKASGERYLFYHSKMNAAVTETLLLENKLRAAIENEQFVLHYQPKLNLVTGKISGLEALIRWNDPENGLIPPVKFIPLLEETGMILAVGEWAIRQALADHQAWQSSGLRPPRIAVNVSAIQLRQRNFVEIVRNAIADTNSALHGLDVEITESLLMEDIEDNIAKLKLLRDMNINIAIDDFGTGYSSLGYLARLPVDLLKIDRSFITTMTQNAESKAIVSTIISLAHTLNIKVIAEGVEIEEQARFLKLLKCDEMQGYLFSKPVPADQLIKMLEQNNKSKEQ